MSRDRLAHLRDSTVPIALGGAGVRTARELLVEAEQVRARLVDLPRAADARVLVLCEDRYHFAVGLLGGWQAGFGVGLPASRGREVIAQLLAAPSTVACVTDHGGAAVAEAAPGTPPTIDLRALDAASGQPGEGWDPRPFELAATLYTSGTTGAPRGIDKRFDQLLLEAEMLGRKFELAGHTLVSTVPANHIYGLLWGVLVPLLAGGRFVRETPLHTREIEALVAREQADALIAVPAHLEGLASGEAAMPSLRRIFSSGAPLDPSLAVKLETRLPVEVTEVFGSTETGGVASRRPAQQLDWTPLSGVEVSADDGAQLQVRSAYTDGGVQVWQGCADRVEVLAGGGFRHLGRSDRVVKVGARRLDLAEMESRLCSMAGVQQAHVLALEVATIRTHEIACVLVAPTTVTRQAVRAHLAQWFDATLLPRRVRVVDALDQSAAGKVSRASLLRLLGGHASGAQSPSDGGDGAIFEWRSQPPGPDGTAWQGRVSVLRSAWCFGGHFEGDPLLPGIVQLNDLAIPQARRLWPDLGGLRAVRTLKFKAPVRPGAELAIELQRPTGEARVRFVIDEGEQRCASGTLVFEQQADASTVADSR